MENKNKVLIIGIDALDPKIINKIMKEGKLPNFERLESFSKLKTTIPPETPVAWSAASTGTNPGKYGIFDFINRDPQTYLPMLNLAIEKPGISKIDYVSAMKGVPFWRILNDNGIQTTVIRWPVTFPAEKINGKMLSGLGTVDIKGMLSSYSFYTNEHSKDNEKIIPVNIENGVMETYVSGPFLRKQSGLVTINTPMKIDVGEDEIVIEVNKKKHAVKVNQWSEMIDVKFKMGMFSEVHGIVKFHLLSTKPTFKMYATSVQLDPKNQNVKITHPNEYGKELAEKIGSFYTLGMPEETKAVTENIIDRSIILEQINQIEDERKKMFYYEFERFNEGALVFAFDSGDRLKHIFWENGKDNVDWTVPKEIEKYYIEKDKLIGDILSKIDDKTKFIIFSDHGFNDFTRQVNMNNWLVEKGYMKTDGSNDNLFSFVEWDNTKAYSLGFTSLYLNLKGREGKGIIEEKDVIIDEIIGKLRNLEDNGKKVFTNLYKGSDVYSGEYVHLAPDIVLGFAPGYRMSWKSATGALDKETIFENDGKWKGDHLIDRIHVPGVLFTNFKINKKDPNIIDIAPTTLKLLNVEIPQNMDGESLI